MNKSGFTRYISIPLLVLLFVLAYSAYQTKSVRYSTNRMLSIYKISNLVVDGVSKWAHERGLSVSSMTKPDALSIEEQDEISKIRNEADQIFNQLHQEIEKSIFIENQLKRELLNKIKQKIINLKKIRNEVDRFFTMHTINETHNEWGIVFNKYRSLIDEMGKYNNQLLEDISTPSDLKTFAKLKHLVWKASELAGRDRAFIGVTLSSNIQLRDNPILNKWLIENKENFGAVWDELLTEIYQSGLQTRFEETAIAGQSNYFDTIQQIRDHIIATSKAGTAQLINHGVWFNKSTEAINFLLTTNVPLAEYAMESVKQTQHNNQRLSLLVGIFCIALIIFVSISSYLKFSMRRRVYIFKQFHNLSDHLLNAASLWAAERGMVETSLQACSTLTEEFNDKISDMRKESNMAFAKAYTILLNADFSGKNRHLIEFEKNYAEIQELRALSDKSQLIDNKEEQFLLSNWFDSFTQLIEKAEELHLVALHLANYRQIDNDYIYESAQVVTLKHFIWVMSEYAGRERAKIGAAISSVKFLPVNELIHFREKIHEAWKIVIEGINTNGLEKTTRPIVLDVKNNFFNEFDTTRLEIINSGWCLNNGKESCRKLLEIDESGKLCLDCPSFNQAADCNNYSMMPLDWFNLSTLAIRNLLNLSSAVSQATAEKMVRDQKSEFYHFTFFMTGFLSICFGLFFSFVLL